MAGGLGGTRPAGLPYEQSRAEGGVATPDRRHARPAHRPQFRGALPLRQRVRGADRELVERLLRSAGKQKS